MRGRRTDPSPKHSREKKAGLVIAIEVAVGLILSIGSFILFLDIARKVMVTSGYIDTTISEFVYGIRTPVLTTLMEIVTLFGNEVVLAAGALTYVIFNWKKHRRDAIVFAVVLMMTLLINLLLKQWVHRPRPAISPLQELHTYSFPSGHAMNSFVFYALLARSLFYLTKKSELGFITAFCSIMLIFFVGFSRIYLGVHYLSDVLAGFVGGFWIVITAILIERTLEFYKVFRSRRTT